MTDVKETAERISMERLEEMLADAISERDRPIIGDGSLYDFAPSELVTALTELLASRHADAQEGGEAFPGALVDFIWQELCEEDRSSPEDQPDMALVCRNDLLVYAEKWNERQSHRAAPSNPVVSDEMVERAALAMHDSRGNVDGWWQPWQEQSDSYRERSLGMVRAGLTAALSVNPQIGSDKP